MSRIGLDFASFLEIDDIQHIYMELEREVGATRAASICGIARTTPDRWREVEFIRPETKTKVLKACIEEIPLTSFEILAERGKERIGDLILTYLSVVYNKALTQINSEFNETFQLFQRLRRDYNGIINNTIEEQIRDMLQILLEKAHSMGFDYPRDDISTITSKNLLESLPHLMEDISVRRISPEDIAHQFQLDVAIPYAIAEAVHRIEQSSPQKLSAEAEAGYIYLNIRELPASQAAGELQLQNLGTAVTDLDVIDIGK